ncbi:MAG: pyruvate carboxyltransferase [Vicinamibacterales bacterium]
MDPWKTKKWFTSPWNWLPEVRKPFNFPAKIKLHDVTLRDGEQQTGVVFRREEKVEIAKRLAAMGVHRIEAGMPAVSPQDRAAISDIAALGLKSQIFSFARCVVGDIKAAKECGATGVIVEIPSSDHIIKNAYGWTVDRAMKSSIDATLAAKELGLYTVFFTIDSTRTEVDRLLDIAETVASEGHMDAYTIADSFGGVGPEAVYHVVKKVVKRLKKPVEIHCHMDFNMGVANTIAALQAGASVAQVTITGLGERAGNVPLEDTVMALKTMYGVDMGIKTELFCETSKFVLDLAKVTIPGNRPIVGDMLYQIESGIVAGFFRKAREKHPLEYVPFAPEMVGQRPVGIVLGKNSGLPSVQEFCEKLNIPATEEQMMAMIPLIKEKSFAKKDLLTEAEFMKIVDKVLKQKSRA